MIDEINVEILPIEKRLDDYNLKKENRINYFNELTQYVDLSKFKGSVPKFWNRINEKLKSDSSNVIPIIIRESNKTLNFNFENRKDFEKFILDNNYNNYDVETENKKDILFDYIDNKKNIINKLKNKIYSFDDILRSILFFNLLIIFLLFILRPSFLFIGSIFKETK
jgi:hypothetical protein